MADFLCFQCPLGQVLLLQRFFIVRGSINSHPVLVRRRLAVLVIEMITDGDLVEH